MRSRHQSWPDADDNDSGTFGKAMGCPVRIPIWSRELLFLLFLLGGRDSSSSLIATPIPKGRPERPVYADTIHFWNRSPSLPTERRSSPAVGTRRFECGMSARSKRHGVGKSRICEPRRTSSR